MKTHMSNLRDLKKAHDEYVARWTKAGKKTTTYKCSHCNKAIETPKPGKEDVGSKGYWDSLTTCIHCGKYNFVLEWPTGKVEVRNFPGKK
jgi:DNA-directed RNA polymerase subunit RPC12/RpoP